MVVEAQAQGVDLAPHHSEKGSRRPAQPDPGTEARQQGKGGARQQGSPGRRTLVGGRLVVRRRLRGWSCRQKRSRYLLMIGDGFVGPGFGGRARGARAVCFKLRLQSLGGRACRFGFLVGATPRFPRFFVFRRDTRKRRGFGRLFGAKLLVCEIGRPSLGFDPLAGQAS